MDSFIRYVIEQNAREGAWLFNDGFVRGKSDRGEARRKPAKHPKPAPARSPQPAAAMMHAFPVG